MTQEVRNTTPLVEGRSHQAGIGAARLSEIIRDRAFRTITALLCTMFLGMSALGSFYLAITQILEDVLCRKYYKDRGQSLENGFDQRLCKVDIVQHDLAFTFAKYFSIRAIVAVVVALPWGIVADRVKRRTSTGLAATGITLETLSFALICYFGDRLDTRLVILTPIFDIIGGSNPILLSSTLAIASDVIAESSRGTVFLQLHVASSLGSLMSPAIAGLIMQRYGPWRVIVFSFILMGLTLFFFVFVVPETRRTATTKVKKLVNDNGDGNNSPETIPEHHERAERQSVAQSLAADARTAVSDIRDSGSVLLGSPSLVCVVLVQLANFPILQCTGQFMNQFASKRYGISIAQTGYLSSVFGIANLVVAVGVVPLLSSFLMKSPLFSADPSAIEPVASSRPVSPSGSTDSTSLEEGDGVHSHVKHHHRHNHRYRDLLLARGSYVVNFLSALVLAASPGIPTFVTGLILLSLGSAFTSLTRALASMYAGERHRARVFTIIAVSEEVGSIFGHPLLAELFSAGMRLDRRAAGGEGGGTGTAWFPWLGLPYFGVAGLSLYGLGLLLLARVPKGESKVEEEEERLLD